MRLILALKKITPKWVKQLIKKIISSGSNFIDKQYFINNAGGGGGGGGILIVLNSL